MRDPQYGSLFGVRYKASASVYKAQIESNRVAMYNLFRRENLGVTVPPYVHSEERDFWGGTKVDLRRKKRGEETPAKRKRKSTVQFQLSKAKLPKTYEEEK